jgi:hypothetical protein
MKGPWRFLLLLVVLSPFVFLFATGFFEREAPEPRPSPRPRPAPFRFCPEVRVKTLPQGLVLKDRDLRNLGDNVMGRSIQYSAGSQRLWVAVGFDVLDSLEDLDFTEESTTAVGGRRVTISTTDIISAHRLQAGTWQDARFDPPCDQFTVVAWNLGKKEFFDIVAGVGVAKPLG